MTCALCKQERELRRSHIIPEFLYTQIYDSIHRYLSVSTNPAHREQRLWKGERERLLCASCEQKLGGWEDYAKKAFLDGKGVKISRLGSRINFERFCYSSFRLFLLSLLWRMGISDLESYKAVSLGPHEEKLRLALMSANPLDPGEYPVVLVAALINGEFHPQWMMSPSLGRMEGLRCYCPVIEGVLFYFFVGSHALPPTLRALPLNLRGEMGMLIEDIQRLTVLKDLGERISWARLQRSKR